MLAVLAVVLAAGCESARTSRASQQPAAPVPQIVRQPDGSEFLRLRTADVPGMTIATVRQVQLPATLEASGQVSFDDRRVASIISRVNGRIEDIRVSQWDSVRRGEPIVALYSPDLMTAEAEYLQALATAKLGSAPGLPGEGGLAATLASAARRKLELLGLEDADIVAIRAPAPTIWMRAPISGIAVEKKALRGAQVVPGDVLFSLATLDQVWITASIYEDDLARVHPGQALEAVTTAYPDEVFKGVISRISPNIDPTTHTLQIRCQVRNSEGWLKPQMLARVKIITSPGSALVAPQEALVFDTDGYYAFVQAAPDRVVRREVAVASWNEQGYARVVAGLKAGERVIQGESIQVNALWHQARGESS